MKNITIETIIKMLHDRYIDSYYDLYPGFSKEKKKDLEYAYDSKKDALDHARTILDIFGALPNPIPLYRTVSADSKKDIDLNNPGDHWSFCRDSAIRFAKLNLTGKIFLISCFTSHENVLWGNTLKNYLEFSGIGFSESEDEITIDNESQLIDVKIIKQLK